MIISSDEDATTEAEADSSLQNLCKTTLAGIYQNGVDDDAELRYVQF